MLRSLSNAYSVWIATEARQGAVNEKGRGIPPAFRTDAERSAAYALPWLARRSQVSTTVSGFSEMLLMP